MLRKPLCCHKDIAEHLGAMFTPDHVRKLMRRRQFRKCRIRCRTNPIAYNTAQLEEEFARENLPV